MKYKKWIEGVTRVRGELAVRLRMANTAGGVLAEETPIHNPGSQEK